MQRTSKRQPTNLYTIADLANRFRITNRAVQKWLDRGMISGTKKAGIWLFTEDDIAERQVPRTYTKRTP